MKLAWPLRHKKTPPKDDWQHTLAIFAVAVAVAAIVTVFGFQSYRVDGISMENTLQNNDRLIIDKLPRTWAKITRHQYTPHRGDIVVFNEPNLYGSGVSEQLIKRVIGLPGDRVVVVGRQLKIYNSAHPLGYDPYAGQSWQVIPADSNYNIDITLQPWQLFVCGDNKGNSTDSRAFGAISANQIIGKLVYRLAPFSSHQSF